MVSSKYKLRTAKNTAQLRNIYLHNLVKALMKSPKAIISMNKQYEMLQNVCLVGYEECNMRMKMNPSKSGHNIVFVSFFIFKPRGLVNQLQYEL